MTISQDTLVLWYIILGLVVVGVRRLAFPENNDGIIDHSFVIIFWPLIVLGFFLIITFMKFEE